MKGTGDSDYISLAGYDISVSVKLVTEPNEQAYHLLYIDWEAATPYSLPMNRNDSNGGATSTDIKDVKLNRG